MHSVTLPPELQEAITRTNSPLSELILIVSVPSQSMALLEKRRDSDEFSRKNRFVISTSKFGVGQEENSFKTPLGLHQIKDRIGGDMPEGTVFKGRKPIGLLSEGHPTASIVHRILRLDGLEPGHNRDGTVDSYRRYIYIHGYFDESTLGTPKSNGCIHMAAADLIPLYDQVDTGTLIWISESDLPA